MKSVFMLEGLWEVVDGTLPEPADDQGNEAERAQWDKKDSRALALSTKDTEMELQTAKTKLDADCGSEHNPVIARMRIKLQNKTIINKM